MKMSNNQAFSLLRRALDKKGIQLKIITKACSGSIYAEFEDRRMGKVRIGDHHERSRYGYRWQLRTDIKDYYDENIKGHLQFFYPVSQIDKMSLHIFNYWQSVKRSKDIDGQTYIGF